MEASDEDEDGQLWLRALDHSEEAFAVLFRKYCHKLTLSLIRRGHEPADADEIAGAAFLELWRRRDSVRIAQNSLWPWLVVTSINLGRNHSRGRMRYGRLLSRLPRDEALDAEVIAHQHLQAAALKARVQAALQDLSKRDSALAVLVLIEDLPVTQAADVLGINYGTARNRLVSIRRALRQQLRELSTEQTVGG